MIQLDDTKVICSFKHFDNFVNNKSNFYGPLGKVTET